MNFKQKISSESTVFASRVVRLYLKVGTPQKYSRKLAAIAAL